MSCPNILPIWPAQNSIPPACFYNIEGLEGWLNKNPSYKQYFVGLLPFLYPVTSTLSSIGYDPAKVPLCSDVTLLSFQQLQQYQQQISLFQKVYGYNLNAYTTYINCGTPGPVYYTFKDFQERNQYKSAVGLVNKLYPFDIMANASTLNWQVPFPILG
jgi:hypothetical protein